MDFNQTGLPDSDIVRKAFDFSYGRAFGRLNAEIEKQAAELDQELDEILQVLDSAIAGTDSPSEKNDLALQKQMYEQNARQKMEHLPAAVRAQLERDFANKVLAGAREIAANATSPSETAIAAAMLLPETRSGLDFDALAVNFNAAVRQVVAEVSDAVAYPQDHENRLKTYSGDARRVYEALMIARINDRNAQIAARDADDPEESTADGMDVPVIMMDGPPLPPGFENEICRDAKILWGTDVKLDARLAAAFNALAKAAASRNRMRDIDGNLVVSSTGGLPPPSGTLRTSVEKRDGSDPHHVF